MSLFPEILISLCSLSADAWLKFVQLEKDLVTCFQSLSGPHLQLSLPAQYHVIFRLSPCVVIISNVHTVVS